MQQLGFCPSSFLRALAWLMIPALMVVGVGRAHADGRSLSYTLGAAQDSYIISGTGFTPGSLVDVIEMPCPELPCGAEGMATTRDVRVSADGTFSAELRTNPANETPDNRQYRLVVAVEPPELAGAPENAFVEVPRHHAGMNGLPTAPAVGSGATADQWPATLLGMAGLALMAAGGSAFALVRVRACRA